MRSALGKSDQNVWRNLATFKKTDMTVVWDSTEAVAEEGYLVREFNSARLHWVC
jgi:hypothetical protein